MITEEQLKKLRSENDLLQLELNDVNMMIQVREEELDLLRQRARDAAAMQSLLDSNLNAFEQMQNEMGNMQQKTMGSQQRMLQIEDELYAAVKEQLVYAEQLKQFNSMEANLLDTTYELNEAATVFKKLASANGELAQMQSNLEIAHMEINSLREEINELKALNQLLLKKNIG